jgi:DNA repair protein RecN (Recombination protein N)
VALPLAKVASSGEAARVTLALKTVLAEVDRTAVLVFDEIDANVGGEVGREIGRELSRLAERNQVFSITHLPQVAAAAEGHFLVEKLEDRESAEIRLADLSRDPGRRKSEIARMLGDRGSETALRHAEEMLAG